MRWFDRWFAKKAKWAWENHDSIVDAGNTARDDYGQRNLLRVSTAKPDSINTRQSFNMRMMQATGGSILEINWYDERKDHHETDLYIIDDGEELAPQLASIIMQHKMRH